MVEGRQDWNSAYNRRQQKGQFHKVQTHNNNMTFRVPNNFVLTYPYRLGPTSNVGLMPSLGSLIKVLSPIVDGWYVYRQLLAFHSLIEKTSISSLFVNFYVVNFWPFCCWVRKRLDTRNLSYRKDDRAIRPIQSVQEKKRPQYSRHNFDKFRHSFVIFGRIILILHSYTKILDKTA